MATPTKEDAQVGAKLKQIQQYLQSAKRIFDSIPDREFVNSKYNVKYGIENKLGDGIYGALDVLKQMNV